MLFNQQADTNKGAVVCNYVRGVASRAQSSEYRWDTHAPGCPLELLLIQKLPL